MKIKLLSIALGVCTLSSFAQSNFAKLWKMQNTANQIEVKIIEENQTLQFVLEGLIDQSSRIFMSGKMEVNGLNQYSYKDPNTSCSIKFEFINADSVFIKSELCELYTLNDSIDGIFTSNYEDLISPRILGRFDLTIENEIKLKAGEQYEFVKSKSILSKSIKTEKGQVIFMASTPEILNTDPEVAYFISDNKISIFYLTNGIITALRSPFHNELDSNLLDWIQKTRSYIIDENR